VADKMFRNGYIIGGEQSGHIILLNHSVTGDGLITALELLKIMKSEGKPLSRLADCMQKYPQVLVNLKVKSKPELTKINGYQDKVNELRNLLGANSQLLIRYSGTEPLLRIMIEAKDKRKIKSAAKDLVKFFRSKLR
jgi:phosphoglucosamine mutase